MSRFLGLLGVSLMLSPASAGEEISCGLAPAAFTERLQEVRALFDASLETRELDDGFAFRFPGDGDWASKLLVLIESERQCCPFFRFELSFDSGQGPVWLRVRGSEQAKAFLQELMSAMAE